MPRIWLKNVVAGGRPVTQHPGPRPSVLTLGPQPSSSELPTYIHLAITCHNSPQTITSQNTLITPKSPIIPNPNHSMSDIPELDLLVDAFPNYPRSELASRLLCASSPEVLFNELLAEVSNNPENDPATFSGRVFDADVHRLKELFPSAQKDNLAVALHRNNGCLDKTIEQMLESDPNQRLARLCGLEEADVAPYMARNKNDVLRALADVFGHYKKRKKVQTSRVQARNTASVAYSDAYMLNDHGTDLVQLKECIWAEPALQELNYDFLLKSLVFFEGDVSKVLDTTRLYIEAGCQSVTFDPRLGFTPKEVPERVISASTLLKSSLISPKPFTPQLGSIPRTISPTQGGFRDTSPHAMAKTTLINGSRSKTPIHLAQPNISRPAHNHTPPLSQPHSHLSTPKTSTISRGANSLDLHGLTVAQSLVQVKKMVSDWWNEEKECRAVEGHIDRYGARAEFMQPLQIITGRGIHSAGGASKIRVSVIRFLSQEGYLMEENIGSVSVYGRKRGRT